MNQVTNRNLVDDVENAFEEYEKTMENRVLILMRISEDAKAIREHSINNAKLGLEESIKNSNAKADLMYEFGIKENIRIFNDCMRDAHVQFEESMKNARASKERGDIRSASVLHRNNMKDARAKHREGSMNEKKTYDEVKDNAIRSAVAVHDEMTKDADAVYAEKIKNSWTLFEKESQDADTVRSDIVNKTIKAHEQFIKIAIGVYEKSVKKALAVHKKDIASTERNPCKEKVHSIIMASSKVFDISTIRAKIIYDEETRKSRDDILSLRICMTAKNMNNDIEKKLLYRKIC